MHARESPANQTARQARCASCTRLNLLWGSPLRSDLLERLEQAGRERALLHAVLYTTGLRKGALAALTLADVMLDDPLPTIELPAAEAKNGKRATLPL